MHDQMMCRDYKPKLDLHFYYRIMPLCIFLFDKGVGYILMEPHTNINVQGTRTITVPTFFTELFPRCKFFLVSIQ